MALTLLNLLKKKARAFLPDRGDENTLNSDPIILEFGRLLVLRKSDGKIRLKIGEGTKTPAELNYVGEAIITRTDATTVAVGGSPAGTINEGKSFDEWIEEVAYPYQNVNLNSISIDQPNLELGQSFNSTILLSCNIGNIANIAAGDAGLVSSSPSIFTPQSFNPTQQYAITGVSGSYNTITDVVITVQITGSKGETSQKSVTVKVLPKMWTGSSALETLSSYTDVQALGSGVLASTRQRDVTFTNNYSFFVIPNLISTVGISFVDLDINTGSELLTYSTIAQADLIYNNDYGVQITSKIWRSSFPFGGQTKARIK